MAPVCVGPNKSRLTLSFSFHNRTYVYFKLLGSLDNFSAEDLDWFAGFKYVKG